MEVTLEHVLEKFYRDEMVAYIDSHPNMFLELFELATTVDQRLSSRAAWLLANCVKEKDSRLQNSIPKIIEVIRIAKKDGHIRDLLYVLQKVEFNDEHEGIIYDLCVNIWSGINKIPSARYTALNIVMQIAKKYPELNNEIKLITQDQYLESLSPGIKRSISRVIKDFESANQ